MIPGTLLSSDAGQTRRSESDHTATAHKLARIIYHMVTTGHEYDETICAQNEMQNRQRLEARLREQARDLGLQVVPINNEKFLRRIRYAAAQARHAAATSAEPCRKSRRIFDWK